MFIIKVLNISIPSISFLASFCAFAFLLFCFGLIFFLMFSEVLLLLFVMRTHLRSTLLKKNLSAWYRMAYYRHHAPSRVQLFATPWTVAQQVFLSLGFSRQKCWSGLLCPPPRDLPDPGIESTSPAMQADFFTSEPLGNPTRYCFAQQISVSNSSLGSIF